MSKDIRWKQRFENFERAYLFLKAATEKPDLDPLQAAGLIQSFEYTFELGWKTLKDYLDLMGTRTLSPREAIKAAFSAELIENGHIWIEMLDKRNELTYIYFVEQAKGPLQDICLNYYPAIKQLYTKLKTLGC